MNPKETHTQCNLTKGNLHYVAWIPTIKAKLGKILRIDEEEGWEVVGVGNQTLPSSWINERSQDYKDFKARIK
jgi:hypothetical protein